MGLLSDILRAVSRQEREMYSKNNSRVMPQTNAPTKESPEKKEKKEDVDLEGKMKAMAESIAKTVINQVDLSVKGTVKEEMDKQNESIKNALKKSEASIIDSIGKMTFDSDSISEKIKEGNEELKKVIDGDSKDIQDKIHVENVKAFRNVQTILESFEDRFAKQESLNRNFKQMKAYLRCTTIVIILLFLAFVAYILYSLGVFDLFF